VTQRIEMRHAQDSRGLLQLCLAHLGKTLTVRRILAWLQTEARVLDIAQVAIRTCHQDSRVAAICGEAEQPPRAPRFIVGMGMHCQQGVGFAGGCGRWCLAEPRAHALCPLRLKKSLKPSRGWAEVNQVARASSSLS